MTKTLQDIVEITIGAEQTKNLSLEIVNLFIKRDADLEIILATLITSLTSLLHRIDCDKDDLNELQSLLTRIAPKALNDFLDR